jgi:hypothetical protein
MLTHLLHADDHITVFAEIQDDLQRNIFLFNLMMKESDRKISVNDVKTVAPEGNKSVKMEDCVVQ